MIFYGTRCIQVLLHFQRGSVGLKNRALAGKQVKTSSVKENQNSFTKLGLSHLVFIDKIVCEWGLWLT